MVTGAACAWFGEARQSVLAAWRVLVEAQGELSWLAGVPEPGEDALAVAERLLAII